MANRLQTQSSGRKNYFAYRSQLPRNDKENPEDDFLLAAPQGPLAIYTTGVWKRESMFMRWMEKLLVSLVQMWTTTSKGGPLKTDIFMKEDPQPESPKQAGGFQELFSLFRRIWCFCVCLCNLGRRVYPPCWCECTTPHLFWVILRQAALDEKFSSFSELKISSNMAF